MAKQSQHLQLGSVPRHGASFQRRHAHNYYLMGRQCAEEGRWEEARPLLERALTLDPEMTAALLTAASLEFSLDHFARARHYSERALALNSQDADAHTLLGNIALAERNPAAALASYRHALDSGGDAVDLHFNTGLAHLFMGEAEKASHIFTRLTDEDPTNHRAWDALGCARRVLKDYTGAVVAFTRALQLDTNSCDARDHLAQVLMDTGNPSRASQILESVLAMEPHRHTTRQLLGMAYAALQDFQRATVCWEELIDKGMASADIYHYLANAYIHLDDTARARKTLQTLISLYPEHVSGHLQLALLLLEDGEQVQGMHHLELARELDPHNPVIAHALLTAEAYSLGASPVAER